MHSFKLHLTLLLLLILHVQRAQGALAQAILYTTDTSGTNARPSAVTISPSTNGTNVNAGSFNATNQITAGGYLSLSGTTNRLTVAGDELLLDGSSVGGGGDTIWTNDNGTISATSESADGDTAFILDTLDPHTTGNLLEVQNAGTNVNQTLSAGGLAIGRSNEYWSTPGDGTLIMSYVRQGVDPSTSRVLEFGSITSGDLESSLLLGTDLGSLSIIGNVSATERLRLFPSQSNGSTAYILSTSVAHTSGNILDVENNGTDVFTVTSAGRTITPSAPPANASAPGVAGSYTWDANFFYICVATDTWKRVAIATW